jgi:hypothetical protein
MCIMENRMFSRHSPFCIFRYFCNMVHVKWNVIIKYSGQAAAMFSVFHNTHIFWPYMASLPMECCRNRRKSYTQFHLHPILLETNALALSVNWTEKKFCNICSCHCSIFDTLKKKTLASVFLERSLSINLPFRQRAILSKIKSNLPYLYLKSHPARLKYNPIA